MLQKCHFHISVCQRVCGNKTDFADWRVSRADKTNGIHSVISCPPPSLHVFCAWACVWHRKHDFFPRLPLQRKRDSKGWLIFIPLIVQQHYLSFAAQSEQKRHKLMLGAERWRPSKSPPEKKGFGARSGSVVPEIFLCTAAGKTRLYLSIFPSIYAGRPSRAGIFTLTDASGVFCAVSARRMTHARQMPD